MQFLAGLMFVILLAGASCNKEADDKSPKPTNTVKESAVVVEINKYRAKHGLKPYEFHPQLQQAAEAHAADMAKHNRMSHTGSDGSNFVDRVKRAGFKPGGGGEIIAGSGDPAESVSMWSQSPGHNAQMLGNRKYVGGAVSGEFACAVFFD